MHLNLKVFFPIVFFTASPLLHATESDYLYKDLQQVDLEIQKVREKQALFAQESLHCSAQDIPKESRLGEIIDLFSKCVIDAVEGKPGFDQKFNVSMIKFSDRFYREHRAPSEAFTMKEVYESFSQNFAQATEKKQQRLDKNRKKLVQRVEALQRQRFGKIRT